MRVGLLYSCREDSRVISGLDETDFFSIGIGLSLVELCRNLKAELLILPAKLRI